MSTARKHYTRKLAAILTVLAMIVALFPVAALAADGPFSDVSGTLAEEIYKAYNAGLVSGYGDGTFRPNANVTRAAFAKMIVLAVEKAKGEELETGSEPFKDVTPGQSLYEYVVKAYKAGYIKGYPDGTFGYNKAISRMEAAAILQRALNLPLKAENFKDVPDNSAFAQQIGAVAAAGIMKGYGDTFKPADNLTRGQAAAVAYRAFEYLGGKKPVEELYEVKAVEQASDSSLRVTFNKAVEDTSAVQFEVTRDGEAVEVTPDWAEDKTSVELKAAATLLNGKYTVTVSGLNFAEGKNTGSVDVQTKLTVASVKLLNAKQVAITFNKPVEKASIIADDNTLIDGVVSFQSVDGALAVDANAATGELNGDGTVLTVTAAEDEYFGKVVAGKYAAGEYIVLVRSKVKGVDGSVLEEYSKVHTLFDEVGPAVANVTADATGKIKIAFSEPVIITDTDKAFTLALNGEPVAVQVEEPEQANEWTWTAVLSVDRQSIATGETYTLTVTGYVQDFAGHLIDPNPTKVPFKFPADATKPRVEKIEAIDLNKFRIVFSEPIAQGSVQGKIDKGTSAERDFDDSTSGAEWSWSWDEDTVLTITLNQDLTEGLHEITVEAYIDLAGNQGDRYSVRLTFKEDKTAPEVESVAVETRNGQRYIVVTFSEPVVLADAQDIAGSAIVDGVLYEDVTIVADHDNDGSPEYTVDSEAPERLLIPTYGRLDTDASDGQLPAGEYTLTLEAGLVEDAAGNTNAATEIKVTLPPEPPAVDEEAPTVEDVWQDTDNNNYVYVQFSESVTNDSALNVANYSLGNKNVFTDAVFTTATKNIVRLTLKAGAVEATGQYLIKVQNVADAAGNVMDPYFEVIELTENVPPKLLSVTYVDLDTVELTFSEPVSQPTLNVKLNGNALSEGSGYTVVEADSTADDLSVKWKINLAQPFTSEEDVLEVSIDPAGYQDAAGNNGIAAGPFRVSPAPTSN